MKISIYARFGHIRCFYQSLDNVDMDFSIPVSMLIDIKSLLTEPTSLILNKDNQYIGGVCKYILKNSIKNIDFVYADDEFVDPHSSVFVYGSHSIAIGYQAGYSGI